VKMATNPYWSRLAPWYKCKFGTIKLAISGGLIIVGTVPREIESSALPDKQKKSLLYKLRRWGALHHTRGARLLIPFFQDSNRTTAWLETRQKDSLYSINGNYLGMIQERWPDTKFYIKPKSQYIIGTSNKSLSPFPNKLVAIILTTDE
jgi:hypothetical protein